MKPEEESIEALSRAILRDAEGEAQRVQEEAEAKAEAVRRRAREQAESERKVILERARQEAERLRSQAAATAELKSRALQLEHREKLLDKVFEAARQRLASIQKQRDYEKVAAGLVREAMAQLKTNQARVRADAATQKILTAQVLDKVAKELNAQITVGKPLEEGTGVVVESSDGRLQYDNTLEARLTRSQSALRSSVYHVLMGEKL